MKEAEVRCARRRTVALAVVLVLLSLTPAVMGRAQVTLSGSNALTVAFRDVPQTLDIDLQNVFNLTCRVGDASITSRTTVGAAGLEAEDLRVRARLGELLAQSGLSFRGQALSRASFDLSGTWETVSYGVALLVSNLGAAGAPSHDSGVVMRLSGVTAGLGYLSATVGIGASPFGLVTEGWCFEGARILLSDLSFCGGRASVDLTFGESGPQFEVLGWKTVLPFYDFGLQVTVRFADLLAFRSLIASLRGSIGDLDIACYLSFDEALGFTFGTWSVGGPLFGGVLSSSTSFNEATLVSETVTWSYWQEGLFVVLGPQIEIESFDGRTLIFGVPSFRADVRWTLGCCDGPQLGELALSMTVTKQAVERSSVTYTVSF